MSSSENELGEIPDIEFKIIISKTQTAEWNKGGDGEPEKEFRKENT